MPVKKVEERSKKELQEYLKTRYNKNNEYINNAYDRISVVLPKGTKERLKAATDESINGIVNRLLLAELDRIERQNNNSDCPF